MNLEDEIPGAGEGTPPPPPPDPKADGTIGIHVISAVTRFCSTPVDKSNPEWPSTAVSSVSSFIPGSSDHQVYTLITNDTPIVTFVLDGTSMAASCLGITTELDIFLSAGGVMSHLVMPAR